MLVLCWSKALSLLFDEWRGNSFEAANARLTVALRQIIGEVDQDQSGNLDLEEFVEALWGSMESQHSGSPWISISP